MKSKIFENQKGFMGRWTWHFGNGRNGSSSRQKTVEDRDWFIVHDWLD